MAILIVIIAAGVPLFITPVVSLYFDVVPKVVLFLIAAAILLLLFRSNLANLRALFATRAGRWFVVLIGLESLSAVIASVFSSEPALSVNGGNWRRFGLITETGVLIFAILTAGWLSRSANNALILLRAITVSTGIASIYGIAQYIGFDPFIAASRYQAGEGPFTIVRPPGTLGHADYFAAWLAGAMFCAWTLARLEQNTHWKRIAAAVTALSAIAILLSGTRAGWLGVVIGVAVLLIANRPRVNRVALVLAAAVIALLIASPAGHRFRARLHWSAEDVKGGARLLLWRDTAKMAGSRPLTGFGAETFPTVFPRFESNELSQAYPDFYQESPHNIFLDVLTGQGIVGVAVLIALCALGLYASWRTPLAASFVAMLVCEQFQVFVLATAIQFYVLLALLMTEPRPISEPRPQGSGPLLVAPFATVSLALAALFLIFAIRLATADAAMAAAHRSIEARDAVAAARCYQSSLRWQPSGAGSDLLYSREMASLAAKTTDLPTHLQAWQQAIEAAARATHTAEDRQNAWYNLSILLAAQNDSDGVERALRNASAQAPAWFKPHWMLARLLEMTNRHDEALKEAQIAVNADGHKNAQVTETWLRLSRNTGNK